MGKNREIEDRLMGIGQKSTIIYLGKIIGLFLGFLLTTFIAKYYGPNIMGQYSLINSIIQTTAIISVFGIDQGIVKYIAKYNSTNEKENVANIILISFIVPFIISVILALIIYFLKGYIAISIFEDEEIVSVLDYVAIIIVLLTTKNIFGGFFKGFKKTTPYLIATEFFYKFGLLASIFILGKLMGQNIISIVISMILIYIVVDSYLIYKGLKLINLANINIISSINLSLIKKNTKILLKYSKTLIFVRFILMLINKIDKFMLAYFMTTQIVGIYSLSYFVSKLIAFPLHSTNMIMSATISELIEQKKENLLNKIYSFVTKFITIISLPIVVTTISFPNVILNFFGEEYLEGKYVLIILVLTQFFNVLVGAVGQLLSMSGKEKILLRNNIILIFLNIILNLILIPKFGMTGAAIATSISILFVNLISLIDIKIQLNIFPYNKDFIYIIYLFIFLLLFNFILSLFNINIILLVLILFVNIIFTGVFTYYNISEFDLKIIKKILKI